MRKLKTKLVIVFILLTLVALLGAGITRNLIKKQLTRNNISDLPDICFYDRSNGNVCLHDIEFTDQLMIIIFHPECDICHYHISDLVRHLDLFSGCRIVMITPCQDAGVVGNFLNEYGISNSGQIVVLTDRKGDIDKIMGIRSWPVTLVYDRTKKLIGKFNGEYKADSLSEKLYSY